MTPIFIRNLYFIHELFVSLANCQNYRPQFRLWCARGIYFSLAVGMKISFSMTHTHKKNTHTENERGKNIKHVWRFNLKIHVEKKEKEEEAKKKN